MDRGGADRMGMERYQYEAYVQCSPEEAWRAITDGAMTVQYFYGTRVESTWERGSAVRYLSVDGESVVAAGVVVASSPPRRLEMQFHARWDPSISIEGPVKTTWEIEPAKGLSRISVSYEGMGPATARAFSNGTPLIVSGMKTLLETGSPIGS